MTHNESIKALHRMRFRRIGEFTLAVNALRLSRF